MSVQRFFARWLRGGLVGDFLNVRYMMFHMRFLSRLGFLVGSGGYFFVVVLLFLLDFLVVCNVSGVGHEALSHVG